MLSSGLLSEVKRHRNYFLYLLKVSQPSEAPGEAQAYKPLIAPLQNSKSETPQKKRNAFHDQPEREQTKRNETKRNETNKCGRMDTVRNRFQVSVWGIMLPTLAEPLTSQARETSVDKLSPHSAKGQSTTHVGSETKDDPLFH